MAEGRLRLGIALALSGGGFRATLFDIGTLTRLNELGLHPRLDNIGLEPIDTFETILVSDAGAPFGLQGEVRTDPVGQLSRALDIATDQARGLRARNLIELAGLKNQKVGYWGIDPRYDKYPAAGTLRCEPSTTNGLKDFRTRLDEFSRIEQETPINRGYTLCDAAVRSFVLPDAAPPVGWPCPDHLLA
jgi:NTE family protein